MGPLKFVGGFLITLVLTLSSAANTLPVQFNPDRDGRTHRYTESDPPQFVNDRNNVIQNSGGDQFRPGRNSSFNLNDDMDLPSNEGDVRTANNPAAPDVPTEVPEPSTLLLMAPAALGFLRKFRR